MYFFCPETRGLSLEEIDLLFLQSNNPLLQSDAAKTLQHKGINPVPSEMEEGLSNTEKAASPSLDGSVSKQGVVSSVET